MVILDLMRVMGGIANGALAEVTIRSGAEHDLADRWCARTGNTIPFVSTVVGSASTQARTMVSTSASRNGSPPVR